MTSQPIPTTSDIPEKKWRNGRFARILALVLGVWAVVTAVYLLFLWPWMKTWGAAEDEIEATLPGDDMAPQANLRSTKASLSRPVHQLSPGSAEPVARSCVSGCGAWGAPFIPERAPM
ncbi:MAG: hypothetical protein R6X34_19780 [Chloroflexota bacterium]|jgi:hypothetical protein